MACNPKCPYFPNVESGLTYQTDSFGVKRRVNSLTTKSTCMYDLSEITNWNRNCPRVENLNKLALSEMRK